MTEYCLKENDRKEKLFCAWGEYLDQLHLSEDIERPGAFAGLFEGLATISYTSKNSIGLHLDSGKKIRHLPVSPEISKHSRPLDILYIMIAQKGKRWVPIEVVSIGSHLVGTPTEMHVTFNPRMIDSDIEGVKTVH